MHFSDNQYSKLEEYATSHSSPQGELLEELVRTTWLRLPNPRMISDAFQGRILSMISHLLRPKRVLELGTFTGYSALCLAEGLAEDGELITIDRNEELEDLAVSFFNRSEYAGKIKMIVGDAMENKEKIITMQLQLKQSELQKIIEYVIIARKCGPKTAKELVLQFREDVLLLDICNKIYKQFLVNERGNNNE